MRRFIPNSLLIGLLVHILLTQPAPARAQWTPPLAIDVRDAAGAPLVGGVVAVCPDGDQCKEFTIDHTGRVLVDRALLLESSNMTLVIYNQAKERRMAASGWAMSKSDRWLANNQPELARGLLQLTDDQSLKLNFSRLEAPPVPGDDPTPRWFFGGGVVFLGGSHFSSASETFGGGLDLSPGWGMHLGRRFGLPHSWQPSQSNDTFFELSINYAMNRYRIRAFEEYPESDLSFHRLTLAAGPGRTWRNTRLSLRAVIGYGGVFDGTTVLDRPDRRYAMPAVGVSVRLTRRLLDGIGLMVEGSAINYIADESDDDYWYGFAPSILLGLSLN